MKRYLIVLLLIISSFSLKAQDVVWANATNVAIKLQGEEWSDWISYKTPVRVSIENSKICIYHDPTEVYNVIRYKKLTEDDSETHSYFCFDRNGIKCTIDLTFFKSGEFHLYVRYNDVTFAYYIEKIK